MPEFGSLPYTTDAKCHRLYAGLVRNRLIVYVVDAKCHHPYVGLVRNRLIVYVVDANLDRVA